MTPALLDVAVPVRNWQTSREWYARLLGRPATAQGTFSFPVGHSLSLVPSTDGTTIAELNMKTRNTRAACAHVRELGIEAGEPVASHGVLWFKFRDPDGNLISINDGLGEERIEAGVGAHVVRLGTYTLGVGSIERAERAYRALGGFNRLYDYQDGSKRHVEYDNFFALAEDPARGPLTFPAVVFHSYGVEADADRLHAAGIAVEAVANERRATFLDPDGNRIGIEER